MITVTVTTTDKRKKRKTSKLNHIMVEQEKKPADHGGHLHDIDKMPMSKEFEP